ncbi:hypothetical protein [Lacrimispora celerecrescens]|uniref:hypothetical protein n=1 Tax=Lacrimispora celerecrescens TaxID=29354 RepID=UPI001645005F|nr:hypothetical protein [Lacrimispora celerecrescens]
MKKINVFKSIVNAEIFQEFEEQRGISLFNHSSNSNFIDDFISAAYVLCPEMVEIKGYVFISDFLNSTDESAIDTVNELERRFNGNIENIEKSVNSWSFGDFFLGKYCKSMENEKILKQFGDILVYFWTKRAKELFPQKNIVVEYGDGLMGELGLSVTMYQQ